MEKACSINGSKLAGLMGLTINIINNIILSSKFRPVRLFALPFGARWANYRIQFDTQLARPSQFQGAAARWPSPSTVKFAFDF